jgi:hypothetical protein
MPASSFSGPDPGMRIRVAPQEVAYLHWPLRQSGWGPWFTLGIAAASSAAVFAVTRSGAMGGLALGSLVLVSWRTWLPIWVEIGPAGVTERIIHVQRRIPWPAIRHYEVCLHGVLIMPDHVLTRLSALRGIYLHWGTKRTEVLANFEYYLPHGCIGGMSLPSDSTHLMQPHP